jgi:hypothetical protein
MIRKGTSLIEALVALAVFFMLVSGVMILYSRTFDSSTRAGELNDVAQISQESFSAVQSIAYNTWANISDGKHGLDKVSGYWQFSGVSDLIDSKYTREIIINSVQRDGDCEIVDADGEVDDDTKLVNASISWENSGRSLSQSFSRYFTNFKSPASCEDEGEAGSLVIDIDDASIDSTKKSIVGIALRNEGSTDITIDKLTISWTEPETMRFIKIDDETVWNATSGIGSPSGYQSSGAEIDIVDFVLEAGEEYDVDNIRFNAKIDGSTVTIKATMSDGTSVTEVTTPPFIP